MKFRTELSSISAPLQLDHASGILSLGSCFADRIGERLQTNKFPALVNPLGIAYDPVSLVRHLQAALGTAPLSAPQYAEHLEAWHSFDLHSQFLFADQDALLEAQAQALSQMNSQLQTGKVLMITLGSAQVFRLRDSGAVVANCHKYPADLFKRRLLSLQQLTELFYELIRQLRDFNPHLQLLLTVSPVRHIRDSLERNAASKATLRLLCQQLSQSFTEVHYFPAYEIMVDDLRDYRFYGPDLIHPNEVAEAYIWKHVVQRHMSAATQQLLRSWEAILRDLGHRPFRPESQSYRKFLLRLQDKLRALEDKLPCQAELEEVQQRIEALPQIS